MGTDFQGFFCSSPCIKCREFERTDDMRMLEHKDVGVLGDLTANKDFGFTKEMGHKVERMDVEVEQGITLRIGTCEIVQIIADKTLFA